MQLNLCRCRRNVLWTAFIFLSFSNPVSAVTNAPTASCMTSSVTFDSQSLTRIFSEPKALLQEGQKFWDESVPYSAARKWAKWSSIELNENEFNSILRELSAMSLQTLKQHRYMMFGTAITQHQGDFKKSGLEHLCHYLPSGSRFTSRVYLAVFIQPWAFAWDNNVFINVSARKWNLDPGLVLNLLLHEVYHVGFGKYQSRKSLNDAKSSSQIIEGLLFLLQNEGMATYVAYQGRHLFPTKETESDYIDIDKPERVAELIRKFNDVVSFAREHSGREVNQRAFQIGNNERAFYVAGAFMAKVIEEKLGRQKLVSLVRAGPIEFASTFNSVIQTNLRIALK